MKPIHVTIRPREGADVEKVRVMALAHLGEGLMYEADRLSARIGWAGDEVARDLRAERAIEEAQRREPLTPEEVDALIGDTALGRFVNEVEAFMEDRLEERGHAARKALP